MQRRKDFLKKKDRNILKRLHIERNISFDFPAGEAQVFPMHP
jgi:hypothetical protein